MSDTPPAVNLHQRIERDFTHHVPSSAEQESFEIIRGSFKNLAHTLADLCPCPSRELSQALSQLELAQFHAIASVARQRF